MYRVLLFITLLLGCFTVAAQIPVPQVNGKCPSYTMKSGDYCVPSLKPGGDTESYIVRNGRSCPYGYFKSGDYCRKGAGDAPESIPREPGKDCPYKWYKSGDYCWKGK